jgi:uncharacterized protein YjbI with pentapeptide repeats
MNLGLSDSTFRNANLSQAVIRGQQVEKCDFTNADLRGLRLEFTRLLGNTFKGAIIDCKTHLQQVFYFKYDTLCFEVLTKEKLIEFGAIVQEAND